MENKNNFRKLYKILLLFIICFSCIATTISCSSKSPQVDDNWNEKDNELSAEIKTEINDLLADYKNNNNNILNFNQFDSSEVLKLELETKKSQLVDENSYIDITNMLYDKLLSVINFEKSFITKINEQLKRKARLENIEGNIVNIDNQKSNLNLVWNNRDLIKEIYDKLKKSNKLDKVNFSMSKDIKNLVYSTKLSLNFNVKISNANKSFDYSTYSFFYITNIEKDKIDSKISIESLSNDYTNEPPSYVIPNKEIEQSDLFIILQFYYKNNALFLEAWSDSALFTSTTKQISNTDQENVLEIIIDAKNSTKFKGIAKIKVKVKPRLDLNSIDTGYDSKSVLDLESFTIANILSNIKKSNLFSEKFKKVLNDLNEKIETIFVDKKIRIPDSSLDMYTQKIMIKIPDNVKSQYYGAITFGISIKLNSEVKNEINFYLKNIIVDQKNNYYMWTNTKLYFGQRSRNYKELLNTNRGLIVDVLFDNQNNYYVATEDGEIYYGTAGSIPEKKYKFNKITKIAIDKSNNLYVTVNEKLRHSLYFIDQNTQKETLLKEDLGQLPTAITISDNNLYIGTLKGKLWSISQNSSGHNIEEISDNIIEDKIKSIIIGQNKNLYVIYDDKNKIAIFNSDVANGRVGYKNSITMPDRSDRIIDVVIDNNSLYILTKSQKFYFYDEKTTATNPAEKFRILCESLNSGEPIKTGNILLDKDNWYLMVNGKIYFAKLEEKPKDNTFSANYGDNKSGMMILDKDNNLYIVINTEAVYIKGL